MALAALFAKFPKSSLIIHVPPDADIQPEQFIIFPSRHSGALETSVPAQP